MSTLPSQPPGPQPGGFPPQPAPAGAPSPAPRRRSWLPWALGGCGCLALIAVLVIGGGVVGWFALGKTTGPGATPEAAIEELYSAAEAKDCKAYKAAMTRDIRDAVNCAEFEKSVANLDSISWKITDRGNPKPTYVTYELDLTEVRDGTAKTRSVLLGVDKEDGRWLVSGERSGG